MGVIGSTLDPVNLIVHKPLENTRHRPPLLCIIPWLHVCYVKWEKCFTYVVLSRVYELSGEARAGKCNVLLLLLFFGNTCRAHLRMSYFHTVFFFHGLKAASQSVLLFFMNILPLLKKAQKHENPSPWLERSTFPEGKLYFSSFKRELSALSWTSYSKCFFCFFSIVVLLNVWNFM